jgi:hypothetical protein
MKGKPMCKTPINLARIIYDAYPNADLLPIDPEQDCRSLETLYSKVTDDSIGDGLFTFIVIEMVEGGEGTVEGAIRVMERAKEDVDAVLQALGTIDVRYKKAAEYLAEQGHSVFTGHMTGGLWNGRTLDACRISGKEGNKAAYEFWSDLGINTHKDFLVNRKPNGKQ